MPETVYALFPDRENPIAVTPRALPHSQPSQTGEQVLPHPFGRPTISVIVAVNNGGIHFRRCLESLAAAVPPPHEIIVVADGDTDGSWLVASELGLPVFRLPTPSGFAAARNYGACEAKGGVLLFVDPDVTVPANAIAQVTDVLTYEPEVAAVFGSYDDAPAAGDFLSQYKNLLHHYAHQRAPANASTFWSACGAVRRSVFFNVGGFDERRGDAAVEDSELGEQLHRAGYRTRLCKTLQVKRLSPWRTEGYFTREAGLRLLPWVAFLLRQRHAFHSFGLHAAGKASVPLTHGFLGALLSAGHQAEFLLFAGIALLLLLAMNASLYRFFLKKRGARFANRALYRQWLLYLYCGPAFLLSLGLFWRRKLKPAPRSLLLVPEGRPSSLQRPEWR
ncbi:MAG: glycosyltransferase [Deltaproteobacteria bacterium]|nr:glycosyltransferase [Deltaproteobacteria bacterium]